MERSTPQQHSSSQSHLQKNPTHNFQKEAVMDKLKQAILKLTNSEPNKPLSISQNSILEKRVTHFLSCLHTTPDHPPYAWMIQRALEELNEGGGSSEDSISKFIKKEYDDLPWAHMTLLKRHLQKLSESGEVLMADGGRFLLAGANRSLNPQRISKRKYLKRKRRWDWDIKQKRRQCKEKKEKKCVQHDAVEGVKEQKKVDEQQNGIRQDYVELNGDNNETTTDKEDGVLNGQGNHIAGDKVFSREYQRITVRNQKGIQLSDATEGPLQSSIASESDVGSNAVFVPTEPARVMMTEEIEYSKDLELQHQKLSLRGAEEAADICNLYTQEALENIQPGDNLRQIFSAKAPPGFEFKMVDKGDNSASVGLDSPKEDRAVHQSSDRPAENQSPPMDDESDALEQSEESLKQQREQHHQDGKHIDDGVTPSTSVLSLTQNQQQSLDIKRLEKEFVAEDWLKTDKKADNSTSVGLDSPKEGRAVHLSSDKPAEDLSPGLDDESDALEESEESLKRQREQQHQDGKHIDGVTPSTSVLSLSQNQQRSLGTERLEKEFVAEDWLKTEKQQKHHGWQQMKRSTRKSNNIQKKETVTPKAPVLLDLQCQQLEQHISDRDRRQTHLALESSSEPKQLSSLRKMTRSQLKGIIAQPASSTASFALKGRERGNSSEPKQQVEKHHGRFKRKEALLNDMLIPDTHQNLENREAQQLTELSRMEGSQEIVLAIVEPSLEKQQQLEEWRSTPEKLNEGDGPDILLLESPTGFEAATIVKAPQTDREQRQLKRWSRNRCEPKPGSSTTLALATNEQMLNLTDPQHEVHLELPKHQLHKKPPKNKEDGANLGTCTISASTTNEVLCLDDPQHDVLLKQLKHKRLGRPPKRKEDDNKPGPTILKNSGLSKKLKKNQNGQGRGRPRKT